MLRVDDHSRLTLTKSFKAVFPIEQGDIIAVYQVRGSNDLIFKVQRRDIIIDSWTLKKNDIGINNLGSITQASSDDSVAETDYRTKYPVNIMVIDDEPDMLLVFKAFLNAKKYNVETFLDSTEALKRFAVMNRPYYNLVITDIRMPKLNGVQLYQRLRETDANVKVLFLSALDAANELLSMFPAVKDKDIIRKPVEEEDLIKSIERILDRNKS